ncbi:MAG: 4Fe-4S dicluster domain-containing protein [Syntrophobacteraceae bacterium]|nr:4Fe-4S dicluster domain-containing protein [Syntrophobacteraceae bacterium]
MGESTSSGPAWIAEWMESHGIALWGMADLRGFDTPEDGTGQRLPCAVSWAIPMNPRVMVSIRNGPNREYADEYARVNGLINELSGELAARIRAGGFRSLPLAASERSDPVNIRGSFPHKTAATRAGLGWIGRHCQLVTRPFGPWIRLGTVFTDMEMDCGPPTEKSFCGHCTRCVEACPARALKGGSWHPGIPREEILDAWACDRWKKQHYFQFHKGHNCGICSAVCPHGLKLLKRKVK